MADTRCWELATLADYIRELGGELKVIADSGDSWRRVAYQDIDLVVCALALTHVPNIAAAFAEFTRVLRPGGHLVIADSRMDYRMVSLLPDGDYGYLPHYKRMTSEYLTTALELGPQVRHCEELRHPWQDPTEAPPPRHGTPGLPPNIWTLAAWCPAAYQAARNGSPLLIFWHFQRPGQ